MKRLFHASFALLLLLSNPSASQWSRTEVDGQQVCQRETGEQIPTEYRSASYSSSRCESFNIFEAWLQSAAAVSLQIPRCESDGQVNTSRLDCTASTTPNAPVLGPPIVQSDTAIRLTLTTACTGGTAPYTNQLERAAGGPSGFTEVDASADFSNDSYDDTGLTASTQYFYRMRCTDNDTNQSGYSNIVNATTDAMTPADTTDPTAATNQAFSNVAATTMTFSWTLGTDNNAVTTQRIYCGLGDGMGAAVASSTFINQDVGLTTSFALTGLDSDQEYYCRTDTFDAAGNNALAGRVFETTDSGTPDPSATYLLELTFENLTDGTQILQSPASYTPDDGSDPGFWRGAYTWEQEPEIDNAQACEGSNSLKLHLDTNNNQSDAENNFRSSIEVLLAAGHNDTGWAPRTQYYGWAIYIDPSNNDPTPAAILAMQFHAPPSPAVGEQDSPTWAVRQCGVGDQLGGGNIYAGGCTASDVGDWIARGEGAKQPTGGGIQTFKENFGDYTDSYGRWTTFAAKVTYAEDVGTFELYMDSPTNQVVNVTGIDTFIESSAFGYPVPGLYDATCGKDFNTLCGNQVYWLDSFRIQDSTGSIAEVMPTCD